MKIALVGYGKMGKEIEKIAIAHNDSISFKIDSKNLELISDISKLNTDVAIEFTRPDQAFKNIGTILQNGVPVVSGTTAWLENLDEAKKIAIDSNTALFYAPNYSVGVNIFFAVNSFLAKLMNKHEQYRVKIEEIHHTEKLDSPSGTAVKQAEGIISALDIKSSWQNAESDESKVVPIISKRISGVPGTHTTTFESNVDEISLNHVAHSRQGFAQGAWTAAHFIKDKKGFFEMKDLLGF